MEGGVDATHCEILWIVGSGRQQTNKEGEVLGKMPSVAVLARLPQGERAAGDSGPVSIAALTNLWPWAAAKPKQEAGGVYIRRACRQSLRN